MEQYHRRAEIAEQRAAEATRGREKLQDARRTAAREILSRIEERNLPPVVHAVLSRPWANYLVLTLLRQGENSDEWKSALRFADEFVWSALPKTNDLERTRLRALLPQLEKALRHGLATVAYHDNDVKQLMQELSQFYQRLLDGEKVEVQDREGSHRGRRGFGDSGRRAPRAGDGASRVLRRPKTAVAAAAGPATQSPVEEIVLNSNPIETPAPEENYAEDDEFLKAAREIKVGTWLEFADEAGQSRAREALVDQPDQLEVPLREPSRPQGLRQDRVRARGRAAPRLDDRARGSAAVRSRARRDRRAPAQRASRRRDRRPRAPERRRDLTPA